MRNDGHQAFHSHERPNHIVIIGDSAGTNSLGRVLSLAISTRTVASTELIALNDGKLWTGAAQFAPEVKLFRGPLWRTLCRSLAQDASTRDGRTLVILSKCAWPLQHIAKRLASNPKMKVIVDLDDDDVEILKSFRHGFSRRIRLPILRRKHPWRLWRSQAVALGAASAMTTSNSTLARALKQRYRLTLPVYILPHARVTEMTVTPKAPPLSQIGFAGTMRPHKGGRLLFQALRSNLHLNLTTFSQAWAIPNTLLSRVQFVAPTLPLSQFYARIDVAAIPLDLEDPAAQRQLPAKLVDALMFGVPIAASASAPILEFASDAVVADSDWGRALATLMALSEEQILVLRTKARAAFEKHFSPEATGAVVEEVFCACASSAQHRHGTL